MKVYTLFASTARGAYCGQIFVNCVFKGINHSFFLKSRGLDKIRFFVAKNMTVITIKKNFAPPIT